MAISSSSQKALAVAGLGLLLLLLCLVLAFLEAAGAGRDCPPRPQQAPDPKLAAYSYQKEIRLGNRLCVGINRPVFFAREKAKLAELAGLAEAVKAARQEQSAAEARARSLTGDARTAAEREAQAAKAKKDDEQKKLDEAKTASGTLSPRREVVLYFGDIRAPAKAREIDLDRPGDAWEWIDFRLTGSDDASTDDAKTWRQILGGFSSRGERPAGIGLWTADSDQQVRMRATLPDIALRVYKPVIFFVGLGGLFLLAIGVGWLGWDSSLLRDGGAGTQFSLGRVQMAWWLLLVTGGFLFIWLISEQWRGVVTGGVVALLGISASTGVAARLADDSPAIPSNGFWRDLVDYRPGPPPQGPALHRVQLVLWTLILSAIFIWTVLWKLIFADFDTNLLLLVGIAGGTYVGFKFKE
jgi:hypothetical protein